MHITAKTSNVDVSKGFYLTRNLYIETYRNPKVAILPYDPISMKQALVSDT